MKYLPKPLHMIHGAIVMFLLVTFVLSLKTPKRITIPVEFCAVQYTGKARTEQQWAYYCGAYNKDMMCVVQVPYEYTINYREVRTTCDYLEWRTE